MEDRDDRIRARTLFRLFQSTSSDSEAIKAFSAGAFIVVCVVVCGVALVVCVVCVVCVVVCVDSRWRAIASSCAAMRASTGSTRSRLIVRMRSVSVWIDALEPGVTRRIFRVVPSGRPFARGFVSVDDPEREFCARLPSLAARGGCCVSRVTGSVRSVVRGSLSIRFNSTNAAPSPRRCGSRVDARARRRVNFVSFRTLGSIVRVRFAPGRFRGRQSASVAPASGTFHRKRATDRPIARSRTVTNDHPSLDPGGGAGRVRRTLMSIAHATG